MQEVGLQLTIEGDLEDFLGVIIDRTSRGAVNLTQPHLIDSILPGVILEHSAVNFYLMVEDVESFLSHFFEKLHKWDSFS